MVDTRQEDVNSGFVSRHSAYWSKIECVKKDLSGSVEPMTSNQLCDALGVNDNHIYPILSKMRKSLSAR